MTARPRYLSVQTAIVAAIFLLLASSSAALVGIRRVQHTSSGRLGELERRVGNLEKGVKIDPSQIPSPEIITIERPVPVPTVVRVPVPSPTVIRETVPVPGPTVTQLPPLPPVQTLPSLPPVRTCVLVICIPRAS